VVITGVHALLYTKDADAARAFFRDVLGFPAVDAGHGWLIFALPPAELAAHPTDSADEDGRCALYLMCNDVRKTIAELKRKGVTFTAPVTEQSWGLVTRLAVPGGGELGLYEPKHPLPSRTAR
jgi:catechol 2,3-dioxygenase-like lactoylglutathione lyase family enzyme